MGANDSEAIERGMRLLWGIWALLLGSLGMYVFICLQLGDQFRSTGADFPIRTVKNILYAFVIITLFLTYFYRKFMLSSKNVQFAGKKNISNLFASETPLLSKYTIK